MRSAAGPLTPVLSPSGARFSRLLGRRRNRPSQLESLVRLSRAGRPGPDGHSKEESKPGQPCQPDHRPASPPRPYPPLCRARPGRLPAALAIRNTAVQSAGQTPGRAGPSAGATMDTPCKSLASWQPVGRSGRAGSVRAGPGFRASNRLGRSLRSLRRRCHGPSAARAAVAGTNGFKFRGRVSDSQARPSKATRLPCYRGAGRPTAPGCAQPAHQAPTRAAARLTSAAPWRLGVSDGHRQPCSLDDHTATGPAPT
jgi:hypothetical protein